MKARRLIDGAAFGPDTLKIVSAAFDAAWQEVAEIVRKDDPIAIEEGRLFVADAVLSLAQQELHDVEALKVGALRLIERNYEVLNGKLEPKI